MQSRFVWFPQFTSKLLLQNLHLVRYDLRGNGDSEKPEDIEQYNRLEIFADDLNAVINTVLDRTRKKKVSLLGWSFGSIVTNAYYSKYGQEQVNSYIVVSGTIEQNSTTLKAASIFARAANDNIDKSITARLEFIKSFTGKRSNPLNEETILLFLGASALSPIAYIRGIQDSCE
ncbi:hypothetical protein G9A89_009203 [Geosiphon pyriformis]|nr:hypothetical protein G9A89_009203 [Geosiphon pyriformis]